MSVAKETTTTNMIISNASGPAATLALGSSQVQINPAQVASVAVSSLPSDYISLKVFIRLRYFKRAELAFNIKKTTRFQRILDAIAKRVNLEPYVLQSVLIHFDGGRVTPDQTPDDLEMEDGSILEFLDEYGGPPHGEIWIRPNNHSYGNTVLYLSVDGNAKWDIEGGVTCYRPLNVEEQEQIKAKYPDFLRLRALLKEPAILEREGWPRTVGQSSIRSPILVNAATQTSPQPIHSTRGSRVESSDVIIKRLDKMLQDSYWDTEDEA